MNSPKTALKTTEEHLLEQVRHHLDGLLDKVNHDLSRVEFEREVADLTGDKVYSLFCLASPEYALIRLMGRLSISIGRRLGEIYDKMPSIVTQARFGLTAAEVSPKVAKKLMLDTCIPLDRLNRVDADHVKAIVTKYLPVDGVYAGLGIEVRYNFNPNDSSRLRKDVEMAELLREAGLIPIYMVFSTISPRDEAIARLKRAGWTFKIGDAASEFISELIGMDLNTILQTGRIHEEIEASMKNIMTSIYTSHAIKSTLGAHAT